MNFNFNTVLRDMRLRVGVSPERATDLGVIFGFIALDGWLLVRHIAYFLATVQWETAGTFRPIKERRASARLVKLRETQDEYWHTGYYGRGYIQLTWKRNYAKASEVLFGDPSRLVENPDELLVPQTSYRVAAVGMRTGLFTGKRLSDYIREHTPPDYVNARRIVNGLDRADEIAQLAAGWELVLRAAQEIEG